MEPLYVMDLHTDNGRLFNSFKYPAGEWQVRITDEGEKWLRSSPRGFTVVARIRSSDDLMRLCLLSDALDEYWFCCKPNYFLPYLPYARADRRFTGGDCYGRGVLLRILKASLDGPVKVLDAHSYREGSDNFTNISPEPYISRAIMDFAIENNAKSVDVLYPDAGAINRYKLPYRQGQLYVGFKQASKVRDQVNGTLTGFDVPPLDRPTLIVDDICDGGGTFLGIAEKNTSNAPLGLYVTHGIFSQGFDALLSRFQKIYYTDSFWPMTDDHPNIVQYSVLDVLRGGSHD